MEDLKNVPAELHGLNNYKIIVPYAFRHVENINAATEMVDIALSNMLIGLENPDKLAQIGGIMFKNYNDNSKRVCFTHIKWLVLNYNFAGI